MNPTSKGNTSVKSSATQSNYFLAIFAFLFTSIVHAFLFPLSHQPDNFEKTFGVDLARDSRVSTLDFYPKLLADDINVYFFYSKLLSMFDVLGISLVAVQVAVSTSILFCILKISHKVFESFIPGICYAITMLFASGLLVYPDFLYSDKGFAPRQFALVCTVLVVLLYINSRMTPLIGVILGVGTLIHPSVGLISFLVIFLGDCIDFMARKTSLKVQVKRQVTFFLSYLVSGGWFAVLIASEQMVDQKQLSSQDFKLSIWIFSVLRHPYTVFDWRQALLLLSTLITFVLIIKSSNSTFSREKKLFFTVMLSSLCLYLTFIVGITFQIPSLISLYGIRVYNLWILGIIMFAVDSLLKKTDLKKRGQMSIRELIEKISLYPEAKLIKSITVLLSIITLFALSVKISQTEQTKNLDAKLIKNIEVSLGSNLAADTILAPTSMQITGSIHHWKTVPRTSSDVLEWYKRLNLITSDYAKEIYGEFQFPVVVWDHNQIDYLQALSQKTLMLAKKDIERLCIVYPIRVFITSKEYNNPMRLKEVYRDLNHNVYEINCESESSSSG